MPAAGWKSCATAARLVPFLAALLRWEPLLQLLPRKLPETAFGLSVSGTELILPDTPQAQHSLLCHCFPGWGLSCNAWCSWRQQEKGTWCPWAEQPAHFCSLRLMGCPGSISVPGTVLRHKTIWHMLPSSPLLNLGTSPERMAIAFWQWASTCVNPQCTQQLLGGALAVKGQNCAGDCVNSFNL